MTAQSLFVRLYRSPRSGTTASPRLTCLANTQGSSSFRWIPQSCALPRLCRDAHRSRSAATLSRLQFVPASGQSWTTLESLRKTHTNKFRRLATELMTIETTPAFGIGQRAILARTPVGNVLWDCVALVDDATVDVLKGLGGLAAIAISHPHYYTTMVEWSRALGGVPIHLHAADRQWVMRPDSAVQFWERDTKSIGPGLTLVRLGGHFDGGTVLHWADWR